MTGLINALNLYKLDVSLNSYRSPHTLDVGMKGNAVDLLYPAKPRGRCNIVVTAVTPALNPVSPILLGIIGFKNP